MSNTIQNLTNVSSMYYHHLMITIFEPFLGPEKRQRPRPDAVRMFENMLVNQTHQRPPPDVIIYEANRLFATLFRLYYIRHGHQNMDIHITISLIFAGTSCLDALHLGPQEYEIESLRSTLILCATGLYHQRRNNYLAHALYSALRARMRSEEVRLLKQVTDLKDDEEALSLRQVIRSKWIGTVVKSIDSVGNSVRDDHEQHNDREHRRQQAGPVA